MERGDGDGRGGSGHPPPAPKTRTTDQALEKKAKGNKYALACAMLASMTSILLGYDIGVMSGAAIYIKREMKISDVQVEILIGILNLYSLLGSFLAGRTSDLVGRRYTVVFSASIFFVGALLMGSATNYAALMAGRFVAGVGVGYGAVNASVYAAEVSPASWRGVLTSLPEVFVNIGFLIGYLSNLGFSRLPLRLGWRLMLGAGAVPSVFLGVGALAMPESPRWLVMQGRLGDAKRVLCKISESMEEAELRLVDIKEAAGIPAECEDDVVSVPRTKKTHGEGVWRDLLLRPTPAVRRILLAGFGIQFCQQSTGIDAVVLYSPTIFNNAGITSDTHKLLATVAVGFVKTVFLLPATFTVDRLGRRPLLLASLAGMLLSLIILATALTPAVVQRHHHAGVALAIVGVLSYVAWFSIGMGPITWVYMSEIFPLRLRAQGTSACVAVNRVVSGVVTMTFLSLSKAVTTGGAFYIYSGVAIGAWLFVYAFLPETRGKTLEEMDGLFEEFRWKESITKCNVGAGKEAKILRGDLDECVVTKCNVENDNKVV